MRRNHQRRASSVLALFLATVAAIAVAACTPGGSGASAAPAGASAAPPAASPSAPPTNASPAGSGKGSY